MASELQRAIDVALAASLPAAETAGAGACPELEQHGLCPAARLQHARRQALLQIVMPLARALFVDSNDTPSRAAGDGIPLRA